MNLKKLTVLLLDDDLGITEEAYTALLDCLPECDALELNKRIEAQDGRFFLPEDHDLQWRE